MIKKIFDKASNENNENLIEIRHSNPCSKTFYFTKTRITLFKQCSNNREKKCQVTGKMFEVWRCLNYRKSICRESTVIKNI